MPTGCGLTRFASDYYQHAWGEVALPALPPTLRQLPGPRYAQALARLRSADPVLATTAESIKRPELTHEQSLAVDRLTAAAGFAPTLLFGVTGSGKTEVYLSVIEQTLAARPKSQALLLLVPEINLTPSSSRRCERAFLPTEWSHCTAAWRPGSGRLLRLAAHEGRARVVIGTRLAVFASLPRLGLIVVDEEHDPSYKAGEGVRYSARDLRRQARAQLLRILDPGLGHAVARKLVAGPRRPLPSCRRSPNGRRQTTGLRPASNLSIRASQGSNRVSHQQ